MNPVICVGRRAGDEWRDKLWQYCRHRWDVQLGWPILEGHHDDEGPFCLSVASNRAFAVASEEVPGWDVAVYVGADWIANGARQVVEAAQCALECDSLYFAHTETVVLGSDLTGMLVGQDDPLAQVKEWAGTDGSWHTNTFSGVVAIPRTLWNDGGGFDERFVGWGFEDLAFVDSCGALRGGYERVPGVIAHLWHPTDRSRREESPTHGLNQVLWERYRAVRSDRSGMLQLLSEKGGPLDR